LFNTNPANLNQSLSMTHWPICVSFKQLGMVESLIRHYMKLAKHKIDLSSNNVFLNELVSFLSFHLKNVDLIVRSNLLKPNYVKTILEDFGKKLLKKILIYKQNLIDSKILKNQV
jgi:hypothetical protein